MKHTYSKSEKCKSEKYKSSYSLRLYCFIFRKQMIKLTSYPSIGEVYLSYIKTGCHCGKLHSPIYWFENIGDIILNDDGSIDKNSKSAYIEKWEVI